ncbi:MAG: FtsX-like permease family protein [Candidatus Thermoplasmatota archaeon]|jgi:ABC-type lipoprotein release transport system permease subunit|nr:FtsX-like permease family protein [Candidatus Thermoplasmatota archaeon]
MNISRHLAWGEIKEHKRIYAIIIIVIALTMTSFMLENAYLNYMMQVVDDTTKIITSDAIITDKSCNIRDLYGTAVELKDAKKIADKIERELPGYKTTIRVTAQGTYGLGTTGEATDGCTIQGIDPAKDDEISDIKDKIVAGRFFNEKDPILRGHTPLYITVKGPGALPDFTYGSGQKLFKEEEPYPIIVGATAAKIHPSVGIGKTLSLTMSMSGRETSYAVITVKVIGMYESGTPTLDALIWFMHADSLREIKSYGKITGRDWHIPGVGTFRGFNPIEIDRSRGDVILVKAADSAQGFNPMGSSDEIKNNVKRVAPGTNVFGWHDFLVYIAGSMQDVITIMLWGSIAVTLFLCGAAIKYVMDSIVLRKTREIGTLKAFGARDRVIFKMFLYQGLIIGLIAGILGVILSVVVMYFVNWYGFNVQSIAGTQLKIGFIVNWFTLLISILLPVTLAVLAAAIPAKKASMLSPVEALRKGELSL